MNTRIENVSMPPKVEVASFLYHTKWEIAKSISYNMKLSEFFKAYGLLNLSTSIRDKIISALEETEKEITTLIWDYQEKDTKIEEESTSDSNSESESEKESPSEEEPTTKICPECEEEIDIKESICPECGYEFNPEKEEDGQEGDA